MRPQKATGILDRLETSGPGGSPLIDSDARERIENLARLCPVYRNLLERYPEYVVWLEEPENRDESFRFSAFQSVWEESYGPALKRVEDRLAGLRKFRRQMSLRIAYRDLGGFATMGETFEELTLLADFCLGEIVGFISREREGHLGRPWDEEADRPARFCVLALGKLGGRELNFCSDLDLIYLFDGKGHCKKGDRSTSMTNEEYFTRLCREITAGLQAQTEDGFLYNVDLRLRPEGSSGPIVRSLVAMESYYYLAGQTWEQLALLRARPVAGNLSLGNELLESIHSFRYPRHAPPSLLSEVAGVKLRTEKEVVGYENLANDIKSGHGGIREIEFFVQTLQLLNAGKNPFLQTNSTREAIERLFRYELIDERTRDLLNEAYHFLRRLEHRLQMREERQTHAMPVGRSERGALALSLGFEERIEFETYLGNLREGVREIYLTMFSEDAPEEEIQEWSLFLSGLEPSPSIAGKLRNWFGRSARRPEARLRNLVMGAPGNLITREHLLLFLDLSDQFDSALGPLAEPLGTLERITNFAQRYGARKEFFKSCHLNPLLFRALSLLFDRSDFIYELLCRYPEILEEIFATGLRRHKESREIEREIGHLTDETDFSRWLWLYVKAEQVRLAIAELLGACSPLDIEDQLTTLADAVLRILLRRSGLDGRIAIVALGKLGAREMTFGSDLDLLLVAGKEEDASVLAELARRFLRGLSYREPQGRIFDLDLRLRPHGRDGPLVTKIDALDRYHRSVAHTWERQVLLRARPVCGPPEVAQQFDEFREELLFRRPITGDDIREIDAMRRRIEREKTNPDRPELSFKAGPGGLLDMEFIAQIYQLRYGPESPPLRSANTRSALSILIAEELIPRDRGQVLLENYEFLRRVELCLRRASNRPLSRIDTSRGQERSLPIWLGFPETEGFWEGYTNRMKVNREIYESLIALVGKSDGFLD